MAWIYGGIGFFLSRHLHEKGWRVALLGRRADVGTQKAALLDPSGKTAVFEQCDVSSYASQAAAFRSCTDAHLKGVMYGTRLATHFMRHNRPAPGGKIVATSSVLSAHPCPAFPEYGAAQAGVIQWVRGSAPLLKLKENITINAVMMGPVITPIMPGLAKAFLPEQLVLPKTVLEAYDLFIDDAENLRTGETVETAHDRLFWYEMPERKAGELDVRAMAVYEPWFVAMHGEKSGLETALQGPPEGNAEDAGRVDELAVGFI
ncbi:hypothetical protein VTH06DRAFT_5607 [Thermothelomyces fergusii]